MLGKLNALRTALRTPNEINAPGQVFDQRRTRTAWFEGQHVTADQFNRDQSYHLTRQSDLGRTIGQGVVEGFDVTRPEGSATMLDVAAGLGLAPSGEVIHLPDLVSLDLADIPTQRRLNALLDAPDVPVIPPETRTGLYVLAVSSIEYSSNPVGSYPVSATATRTLEDSVINEAVLFTLTPYPVPLSNLDDSTWRRSAAYRVFIDSKDPELPAGALPLAMVALSGNRVLWVDVPMVRRACSPASGDIFGLGLVDQARRVAHFEQFDATIAPVIDRETGNGISAASLVDALPPMGRLPVASIAMNGVGDLPERLSQTWLPASVPCELVALPEDEIDALLRESVHLPPIDLTADDKVLANTPVSIIVPVKRADWVKTPGEVLEAAQPLTPPVAVGGAPTDPAALLEELINGTPAPTPSDTALTAEWRALLGQASELWYARRRQFQRSDDTVTGLVQEVDPDEVNPDDDDVIVVPRPIGVDPEPLVKLLSAPLAELHQQFKLDGEFEELLSFDPEQLLPLLIRQQQAASVGAATLVGAITLDVINFGRSPDVLAELYEPRFMKTYGELEPVLFADFCDVIVAPSQDSDLSDLRQTLSKFSELGPSNMRNALISHAPLAIRGEQLLDADALGDVLAQLQQARVPLAFALREPFSEKVLEQRVTLLRGQRLPELTQVLARVERPRWPELCRALRSVFEPGANPEELVKKLIETAEGFA